MRIKILLLLCICVLPLLAETKDANFLQQSSFPYPKIPFMIRNPEDRKAYLLKNYWTEFDFSDKTMMDNRNISEQGFVDFISLLADKSTTEVLVDESMEGFCKGLLSDSYSRKIMMEWVDDYLYNPNSPMYNEKIYISYLQSMKKCLTDDDALHYSIDFKIKITGLNRIGHEASDFTYFTAEGKQRKLSTTQCNGRLILVFYDPECEHCHATIEKMATDVVLKNAVRKGVISVLAIYTEGNSDTWKKTVGSMPAEWMTGDDRSAIRNNLLYDLKGMPSLYLLDEHKRVILKDASYELIRRMIAL